MITYWYPPKRSIASLRCAKFAKYLPDFGWEPVVITVIPRTNLHTGTGSLSSDLRRGRVYRTQDLSLNELCYALVQRAGSNRLTAAVCNYVAAEPRPDESTASSQGFGTLKCLLRDSTYWAYKQVACFPDEVLPWMLEYRTIERIARQEQPNVVLSCSLPNTCHLLASRLSRRLRLPWVADFRDLWTVNYTVPRSVPLRWLEVAWERRAIRPAKALVTVSEPLKRRLERLHRKPVYVVQNGFDAEDLPQTAAEPAPNGPLRIVYTGLIYRRGQDPQPLFSALQALVQNGRIQHQDVEVCFYGPRLHVVARLLERYRPVRRMVRLLGEVSYQESLLAQRCADVLLLFDWMNANAPGVYTGKVFEYLGAGRPILSIGGADSVVEALLKETRAGVHLHSVDDIASRLLLWLEEKRSLGQPRSQSDWRAIQKYNRREQTRRLAEILDEVAAR